MFSFLMRKDGEGFAHICTNNANNLNLYVNPDKLNKNWPFHSKVDFSTPNLLLRNSVTHHISPYK